MPTIKGALARIAGTITRVRTRTNVIALTFDDGPHPAYTPRLLDILDRYDARATFFVLGIQAQRHPKIIERMIAGGHALGCHSWDHPSFPAITGSERRRQIRRWEAAVPPQQVRLFRPPFGHQNIGSYLDARLCGYRPIIWSRAAVDWLDHDGSQLSRRLLEVVGPGEIILMHDNLYQNLNPKFTDRGPTIMTVETLLENLGQTYRFVSVPELFRYGRIDRKWYLQPTNLDIMKRLQISEPEPE